MKDLALREIEIDPLKLQTGDLIKYFGSLSAAIRAVPSERQKIRDKVNPHTVSLLEALNAFIQDAKSHLPDDKALVVLVDNLDRIVPETRGENRTSHDEIFIDRAEQLKRLDCHVVYVCRHVCKVCM